MKKRLDSADRKTLVKILSLYGKLDKCFKVISTMHANDIFTVEVRIGVCRWFHIESGVKEGRVLSPFI
jgi:hypothetical protein